MSVTITTRNVSGYTDTCWEATCEGASGKVSRAANTQGGAIRAAWRGYKKARRLKQKYGLVSPNP